MKGQSTHIPFKYNWFSCYSNNICYVSNAISYQQLQVFSQINEWAKWITSSPISIFNSKYMDVSSCICLLTIFFTWFYTQVTFKPDEMSENLHKSAGFIPGVRPGEPTTIF